jgi:DNA-binding HxlR family transcriptional regulator
MLRQGVEQREPNARVYSAWTPLARALTATGDRWTLNIVLALAAGPTRLTHLHRRLPGVSTSVLESHLQRMVAAELITRTRREKSRPRVELELTDAGRELVVIAGMLARWGMRNRWSEPADKERTDVGALLRMLPTLIDEHPGLPEGATVEARLASPHALIVVFYRVEGGRLQIEDIVEDERVAPDGAFDRVDGIGEPLPDGLPDGVGPPPPATVCLQGDEQAWIAALGPVGDYTQLRCDGKAKLAKLLFDGLPGQTPAPR